MFDGATPAAKIRAYFACWDGFDIQEAATDAEEFAYRQIILLELFYLNMPLDSVRQQIEEVRSALHYEGASSDV
jgi:hypothetical protein